ncbi:TrbI/VirB10 family protein [Aquidulcibacter sp.]|jgi:type IV secretory pathway VirB10-like protein|uniref:TrbI/VirB10 family protein n=1 Tax=Aquidulcibacter sp. TaxID=2052990 RepID=UPI0037C0C344
MKAPDGAIPEPGSPEDATLGKPLTGGQTLHARVAPQPAQQINRTAVRGVFILTASVISLAFIYGFVIAPIVQADARARQADETRETPTASVRPAEVLTQGPSTYAELTNTPILPEEESLANAGPTLPPDAGPAHEPRLIMDERPSPYPQPMRQQTAQPTRQDISRDEAQKARQSALFFGPLPTSSAPTANPVAAPAQQQELVQRHKDYDKVYGDRAVLAPLSPYELKAGSVIPAALLTAIDTEREGRVIATVTENVFDTVSGSYLLIPQGARLLGRFDGDQTYGERRAFLVWERLIFPDGRSISLAREPGVDGSGAGGVAGRVDRRIPQLLTATLFAGAITTLGEAARRDGTNKETSLMGDVGDAAAIEAARIGGRMVDRELEVKPTIRVRQGTRVQVLLTRDLILEPSS